MGAASEGAACHIAGCERPAAAPCDNCGQRYCDAHLQTVTLQRRAAAHERRAGYEPLARLPSRSETYRLCPRCSKRPFSGKPQLSLPHQP